MPDYQDIKKVINTYNCYSFLVGMYLSELKKTGHYKEVMGEGQDKWHDFLFEWGITPYQANQLMRAADVLENVEKPTKQAAEIPAATLKYLGSLDQEITQEMLDEAKVLTLKDFKERYYDIVTEDKGKRTYSYMVMRKCNETGTLSRVQGVESDAITNTFNREIDNGQ